MSSKINLPIGKKCIILSYDNKILTCEPDINQNADLKFLNENDTNDKKCQFIITKSNNGYIIQSAWKDLYVSIDFDIGFNLIDGMYLKSKLMPKNTPNHLFEFDVRQELDHVQIFIDGKRMEIFNSYFAKSMSERPLQDINYKFRIVELEVSFCNVIEQNRKYIILPGSSSDQEMALTCVEGLKTGTLIKPITNYKEAFLNPSCHFEFIKKEDSFYIKSAYSDLYWNSFKGPSFVEDRSILAILKAVSIGIVLDDEPLNYSSQFYIKNKMNNFILSSNFAVNGDENILTKYNLSMYKSIDKDSPLVFSWYKNDETENYTFRIISIDKQCGYVSDYNRQRLSSCKKFIESKLFRYNFLTDNMYFLYLSNIDFLKKNICVDLTDGKILFGSVKVLFNMKKDSQRTKYISINNEEIQKKLNDSIVSIETFEFINRNDEYIIKVKSNKCLDKMYYLIMNNMKLDTVSFQNDDQAFANDNCIFYISGKEHFHVSGKEHFHDIYPNRVNHLILIIIIILIVILLLKLLK
jgi:hypothetical protein